MSWLVTDSDIRYIDAEHVSLEGKIPNGYYNVRCAEFIGFYGQIVKPEYEEKKIYGKSNNIADHVLKAWESLPVKNNLGVLFSGGKGLGKSLTTTILAKKAVKNHPVLYVDTFYSGLSDFLSKVKNSVIIIDEFEKVMRGNAKDEDHGITKQETLLSVLDGTVGQNHNLYILTCNDARKLDENLLSRPGRIRYHYKFKSLGYEEITAYCEDKLDDKSKIDEVASSLMSTRYVSHDILISLVDELNVFKCSVEEALERLNIESSSAELEYEIYIECRGEQLVSKGGPTTFHLNSKDESWYGFSLKKKNVELDDYGRIQTYDEDDEDEDGGVTNFSLRISMDFTKVKMRYFGDTDITEASKIKSTSGIGKEEVKIIKVVVRDPEASSFEKIKKVF